VGLGCAIILVAAVVVGLAWQTTVLELTFQGEVDGPKVLRFSLDMGPQFALTWREPRGKASVVEVFQMSPDRDIKFVNRAFGPTGRKDDRHAVDHLGFNGAPGKPLEPGEELSRVGLALESEGTYMLIYAGGQQSLSDKVPAGTTIEFRVTNRPKLLRLFDG